MKLFIFFNFVLKWVIAKYGFFTPTWYLNSIYFYIDLIWQNLDPQGSNRDGAKFLMDALKSQNVIGQVFYS